jgi:hypothetical protein
VFKAIYKELPPLNPGDPPPFFVELTLPAGLAGQPISLLRNGQVIGKALAGDGSVVIAATFNDGAPKPGELSIALEPDGAAPLQVPVDGVPPRPTALTQSCPQNVTVNSQTVSGPVTVTGTLPGVPQGAKVTVTFQAPPGPNGGPGNTYVKEVTTDANGAWSATATAVRADLGTWSVSSSYAAADGFAGSSAGPCTFTVQLQPS